MKRSTLLMVFTMAAALVITVAGCKHRPVNPMDIPGHTRNPIMGAPANLDDNGGRLKIPDANEGATTSVPDELKNPNGTYDMPGTNSLYSQVMGGPHHEDASMFAQDTVYFDTDSSEIKASEQSKLEHVADYFKNNKTDALKIAGYCDERGTEGYNLALGDRRAQSIREYLIGLGVEAGRVGTVSFGEADPVDPGHNETAWKKNRRGLSILEVPDVPTK